MSPLFSESANNEGGHLPGAAALGHDLGYLGVARATTEFSVASHGQEFLAADFILAHTVLSAGVTYPARSTTSEAPQARSGLWWRSENHRTLWFPSDFTPIVNRAIVFVG